MIANRLRQLSQRLATVHRQRIGLMAASSLLAVPLLVAAVDVRLGLPWPVRVGALGIAVAIAVLLARRGIDALTTRETAKLVEKVHPELGQSVRTAAQVASDLASTRPPIEAELVEQTAQRVAPLPLDAELASRRPLAPWAVAAAALVLGWIVALSLSTDWRTALARALGAPVSFTRVEAAASPDWVMVDNAVRIVATVSGRATSDAVAHVRAEGEDWREVPMSATETQQFDLMLPKVGKALEYYVTAGDGRSESGRVGVRIPPALRKIVARLEYPGYLGMAPGEQTGGDLEGVEGTKAEIDLEFDRPVLEARVVFSDGTDASLAVEGARAHISTTLVAKERTWRVTGRDPVGIAFETAPYRLKGTVDLPPVIKLAEPRSDVEVTSLQELIARVHAKDDHGLASVGILLQIGPKTETLMEKRFEAPDVRNAVEMATAYLEKHDLTINDSLLVYAYATDHKPREGARVVSPLAAVDIREFKRLWRQGDSESKECHCQNLLEKIISLERRIYSDTTQLKELSGSQPVPKALVLPLVPRQQEALGKQQELQTMLDGFDAPDMREMQETSRGILDLMGKVVVSLQALALPESCTGENATLTALLTLRRQMIYKFGKKSPNARMAEKKPDGEKEQRPSLTQLAAQLEAAAKEEQDVKAQANDGASSAPTPAALLRQHDAATGDVGEVLAELEAHPAATDLARERIANAEALMNEAAKALREARAAAAAPLTKSEGALRELSAQLRLLDQAPDEGTLAKLEQRAEKAAECLAGCAKCAKAGPGKSGGKGSSAQAGEVPGSGEAPAGEAKASVAETPGEFAAKVAGLAEQAKTLDDALRHWSGGADGTQPAAHPSLSRMTEAQKTQALAGELAALAQKLSEAHAGSKPGGEGKANAEGKPDDKAKTTAEAKPASVSESDANERLGGESERLAERHEAIAAALRTEREALRQTRAQQLAELRNRLQQVAGDNFTGPPASKGTPLEPSPTVRTALVRSLPAEGTGRLIDDLRASGDVDLVQWAAVLETNRKRPVLAWRALRLADMRLATILTGLKRVAPVAVRESAVPEAYRRLVESYFRALSDDFGSEDGEQGAVK